MPLLDPPRTKGRPRQPARESRTLKQTLETWEAFDALPGANTAERFRNLLTSATHGAVLKKPVPKIVLLDDGTWLEVKQ